MPNELVIGDWRRASDEAINIMKEEEDQEVEIDEEEDENKDVFFVEFEGTTLQVGRQKKKKNLQGTSGKQPEKPRRQVTCSICKQQGHNKRGCPQKVAV